VLHELHNALVEEFLRDLKRVSGVEPENDAEARQKQKDKIPQAKKSTAKKRK
jgi:hypothetical protein